MACSATSLIGGVRSLTRGPWTGSGRWASRSHNTSARPTRYAPAPSDGPGDEGVDVHHTSDDGQRGHQVPLQYIAQVQWIRLHQRTRTGAGRDQVHQVV